MDECQAISEEEGMVIYRYLYGREETEHFLT